MAISGAQIRSVLASVGAVGGQVTTMDSLAAGANDALKRLQAAQGKPLSVAQCAAFLATLAQESGYFKTTTEYGSGQRYAPYIGRTFEQLTWRANYAAFGSWAKQMGVVTDANVFVNNPTALSGLAYAWLGGVWYWIAKRSGWGQYDDMLDVSATGSILLVSRAVNAGNPNSSITPYGMPERTAMFNAFKALGTSILPSSSAPPAPSKPSAQTAPAGVIPGTPAQVIAEANRLWNQYKGKLYCYNWPGLKELGRTSEYWCADFVRLAIRRATGYDWAKNIWGAQGPAYCPALVSGAIRDPHVSEVKYKDAKPGDVVFFFRGATAYHTGLVEFGPTAAGHDMRTIEGNTSTPGISSSMSAGGTLAKKTRDDRYYVMRIFRPTYWVATQEDETDTTPATTVDAPEIVQIADDERPDVNSFDAPDDELLPTNPVDELNVSRGFWAAVGSSAKRVSRASLWYDGRPVDGFDELPLDANQSKISVGADGGSAVRRRASLAFTPRQYGALSGLRDVLEYPGTEIRVETGFDLGGVAEMVPVFQSSGAFQVDTDGQSGVIKVDAPDRMEMVASDGIAEPVWSNPACSIVQGIQWFIRESDPSARLVDLTGNKELLPDLFWDAGATSRIDAVTSLAAAIGAEIFKSPAAGVYVLRPMVAPGYGPSRWTVKAGRDLVTHSRHVDKARIYNRCQVESERADTPVARGIWADTNPDSVTRFGGPMGRRTLHLKTSLLSERDDLEAYAQAVVARLMGGRVDVDWSMLVNPLMEAGDTITVLTPDHTYACVLDSFEIPLGSQRAIAAKARSLTLPGVS